MKIQKIISAWLSDEKRTAEYLAQRVGVSGGLMRMILRGERKATPETLVKLAPVLGIPAVRLLVDAGYLKPEDLAAIQKESQIPPDLVEALRDPEMVKILGKLWRLKTEDPPFVLQEFCNRVLDLPADQVALVENLLRNMSPRASGT